MKFCGDLSCLLQTSVFHCENQYELCEVAEIKHGEIKNICDHTSTLFQYFYRSTTKKHTSTPKNTTLLASGAKTVRSGLIKCWNEKYESDDMVS